MLKLYTSWLVLAAILCSVSEAKKILNCTTGVPDIAAVEVPPFPRDYMGLHYVYATYSTDPDDYSDEMKCWMITWTCNDTEVSNKTQAFFVSYDAYYNTTSSQWVNETSYYIEDPTDGSNYIQTDKRLRILRPTDHGEIGRVIIKTQDGLFADYGWFPAADGKQGECGYWWTIYGQHKNITSSRLATLIGQIGKLGLVNDTPLVFEQDC